MNSSTNDDSDDLTDGVFQSLQLGLEPLKKEFKPWHKPRKHFVRVKQWCAQVQKLIKNLGISEGDVLTYLGMPGEDFLDLRTLHEVCKSAQVRLRYLGFDSTANCEGTEFLLSEHEVSKLELIDPRSKVLKDQLESMVHQRSIGGIAIKNFGTFDVINLDLCDSIATPAKHANNVNYFDTLQHLCNVQLNRGKRWLLFLTTRTRREQIHSDAKAALLQCILDNATANSDFSKILESQLELAVSEIAQERNDLQPLDHPKLVRAFCLGIGKWFLRLMMSNPPVWHVKMLPSYGYSVDGKKMDSDENEMDMLSLTFQFDPYIEPHSDSLGLAKVNASVKPKLSESEAMLAEALVGGVGAIKDIDELLANDTSLREKTVEQFLKILEDARYDLEAYREFLRSPACWGGRTITPL